ncbi:LOW QUALITY PROTEIN: peptidyl-prolyl cis-trans isomerase CYP59-like [Actinidia eriantha]|uniref:LOW QUALITY PROTEIN: peptidyl-prolyl cis-trans isomerase CYP59-like n=1 Tax=Actinidia eriantha TaxID=165200 RepID=UPI0025836932|nr:LOW QUALITY PROTEIN: peptidyl-prolyl cis-trans isomerase CYP59-like [Actinidia eriantha]
MSVLIVTSLGDIVVDLHTDLCPLTAKNFLKLCKIKYYNGCLFHTIQKDFTAQTGDPTGSGAGGDSIYKFLYGDQARFFGDEIRLELKHTKMGTIAMASAGEDLNASQFYITLRDDLDYLDGKHTVFGEVAEGLETLQRINEAYVDEKGRPYKNIRIKHTYILDDPFDDPAQLIELIPDVSPEGKPKDEVEDDVRLEDDWVPMDEQLGSSELEEVLRAKVAHSSAVVLESIGDIPDADIKPPDNVLFVCKLNPVTEDEDLHTIFSRFGTVTSADVIRDFKTGDSLCYAFIEFEDKDACEQAYFKMDNALIDDRRIHVDFSQSVSKLWSNFRRGQSAKGKGCFKCGAPDHIAKDCTGNPSIKQQPSNYILKNDNGQRGEDGNSRYEMVFDEDAARSPQREKRGKDNEIDHVDKRKVECQSEDLKQREHDRSRDRHRHSDRSRGNREDERSRIGQPRRDSEYHEERRDREKDTEKRVHKDNDRRDDRDYRKRSADGLNSGDRRNERDYSKRSEDH